MSKGHRCLLAGVDCQKEMPGKRWQNIWAVTFPGIFAVLFNTFGKAGSRNASFFEMVVNIEQ
jgi:hypothetical protein